MNNINDITNIYSFQDPNLNIFLFISIFFICLIMILCNCIIYLTNGCAFINRNAQRVGRTTVLYNQIRQNNDQILTPLV